MQYLCSRATLVRNMGFWQDAASVLRVGELVRLRSFQFLIVVIIRKAQRLRMSSPAPTVHLAKGEMGGKRTRTEEKHPGGCSASGQVNSRARKCLPQPLVSVPDGDAKQ